MKKISVIKIDVQGVELEVLKGATNILKLDRPVIIFEHEDDYHDNPKQVKFETQQFFDEHHYDLFVLDSNLPNVRVKIDFKSYVNCNIVAYPRYVK